MSFGRAGLVLSGALAAGAMSFGACDDTGDYLFLARQLDESRGCLGDEAAIDVISGSDPGLGCAARCFVSKELDDAGGYPVFATTMCGPAPLTYAESPVTDGGLDPRCVVALAAVSRSDICLPDGGDTNPADGGAPDALMEAGFDSGGADAAEAGAADAGADASDAAGD